MSHNAALVAPTKPQRLNTGKERVRLTLDLSPELNARLERLATSIDGTKSDVLRKAIALVEVAVEGKQRGLRLGLADKNQALTTEIVGL